MNAASNFLSDLPARGCLISEMQAKSDAQLLREYSLEKSESAFGEVVHRHADLVYSAALRQVGSPDLASEIAQRVFIDLARKARSLAGNSGENASLAGWLYRATRYAALNLLRDERRRHVRERQVMQELHSDIPNRRPIGRAWLPSSMKPSPRSMGRSGMRSYCAFSTTRISAPSAPLSA